MNFRDIVLSESRICSYLCKFIPADPADLRRNAFICKSAGTYSFEIICDYLRHLREIFFCFKPERFNKQKKLKIPDNKHRNLEYKIQKTILVLIV